MSEYIIIDGISYAWPGSSLSIFENLSLTFNEGWSVFSGANGSGKTTLASLIASILIPDKGSIRRSGNVVICPQVFSGLEDDDPLYIYDGSRENGELKSRLHITDEMVFNPENLSGGEKKRLQLLAALSRKPSILILDEPTNHLDKENKYIILSTLKDFRGVGILITHDRDTAEKLSERTLLFERGENSPARIHDIPLPLSLALEELEKRKKDLRNSYDSLTSEINKARGQASRLEEKSKGMERKLSKAGIDKKDHSAKAKIDGARLTGKDRSFSDQMRRINTQKEHKEERLRGMERPKERKEGLSLRVKDSYLPSFTIPSAEIIAGDYHLHVPKLTIQSGDRIAITGNNGTGKTLLLNAIKENLIAQGKEKQLLFIPQEYTTEDEERIKRELCTFNDTEYGAILSDMYRLGANPSFLLDEEIEPSPGEMKKLDFVLSRRRGGNIIMMDEITNHLDITSMKILEDMLKEDKSFTLILISHDEAFIKAVCKRRVKVSRTGNTGEVKEE